MKRNKIITYLEIGSRKWKGTGVIMNLELEHVNALPVRTWSWTGVNETTVKVDIPEIVPYKKKSILSGYTSDIIMEDNNLHCCQANEKKNDDTIMKQDSSPILSMQSGMGNEMVDFVMQNKNSGISIKIPSNIHVEKPIIMQYDLDEDNSTVVDFNQIIAEEDSEVTVIMNYSSKKEHTSFHGGLTYLYASKNAIIHLIQIQRFSEESIHFNDIGSRIETGGIIDIVQTELGAKQTMNGCRVEMVGDNSTLNIDTIYFGDKNRSIDINYVVNHIGKQSHSEMNLNGALLDSSRKIFRGTIDFKKGAVGAIGHESEYNLLFSPTIRNITAPLILCGEENVEGKHAANSGKIDEDILFYMMTRGLDEMSAKKMVIESRFQPVIEKIPNPVLQKLIKEYVKERLTHIESI